MKGELEAYHAPSFTHYPLNASLAPAVALDPDEPDPRAEEAVKRIIAAFRSVREESVEPASSMWEEIERDNEPFVKALNDGDAEELQRMLSRMFQTDLVWGLGRLEKEIPRAIRDEGELSDATSDKLKSFLEDFVSSFE